MSPMKRTITAACLAAACAVGLSAQGTGTAGTATQDPAPGGQGRGGGPRTATGCLRAGDTAGTYMLTDVTMRSEEHTSELQSLAYLVCRLLLEKKKRKERA